MMEFSAAFEKQLWQLFALRRDVRRFQDRPVDEALLDKLLGVVPLAPSVGLSEPWRIVKVRSKAKRSTVIANFEAANAAALRGYHGDDARKYAGLKLSGLQEAPEHLAFFCDCQTAQGKGLGRQTMPQTLDYSVVSAITLLWLAARAEGLGLGWVSILEPQALNAVLDVPAQWKLIGYLCLGWPKGPDTDIPELQHAGREHRHELADKLLER